MSKEIDPALVEEKAGLAFGYLGGAVISGAIYLGDRLGLYRAMRDAGPLTSDQLAERMGLKERWLREWLNGQAAAGLIEYRGEGRFELTPEGALVLADEDNPASAIGGFDSYPEQMQVFSKLPESFKTGLGLTYDDGGPAVATSVERMLGPWNKTELVGTALPAVPGLVDRLKGGARVADVGCGAGVALIAMAKAFPKGEYHGYDNSHYALERAARNLEAAGVSNVKFHNVESERLPEDGSFDLITTLDCLHDMARPDIVMQAIRKSIKPEGVWFIADVNCGASLEENLQHPLAAMMYGFSLTTCMSSSLSQPDGLGLGTVGLPEPRLREMVTQAGFTRFQRISALEHPFNAYYEVRP